jgi:hypothetical protein
MGGKGTAGMDADESVQYWRIRQAEEHEKLLAEMKLGGVDAKDNRLHPLVLMEFVLRTDPRYKWKPFPNASIAFGFPVVVFMDLGRIEFKSSLIQKTRN